MSYLVLMRDVALLLDAGTGVARLLEAPIASLLQNYSRLNIILSHYHLDHTIGLSYLPGVWGDRPVTLFAPEPPFTEASPSEALDRLLHPPLFTALRELPGPIEVVPFSRDSLQIGTLSISLRAQKHPGGSVGIRIEDRLAYVTDTLVDQATVDFVRGTNLVFHEVWLTDAEAEMDEVERLRHSFCTGVVQIANEAGLDLLMPVHHHPRRPDSELREMAEKMQASTTTKIVIPQEGSIYELI
ncbi:MAG: MBL fold metallo-hydrolase [Chloroflexota bacterium]|nr:MBL fold metallo-hydrolase [Chloroflexota bacterium]